jgi:hypothetical protein
MPASSALVLSGRRFVRYFLCQKLQKASPAARQLSLPPLPMQPRDCDRHETAIELKVLLANEKLMFHSYLL